MHNPEEQLFIEGEREFMVSDTALGSVLLCLSTPPARELDRVASPRDRVITGEVVVAVPWSANSRSQ